MVEAFERVYTSMLMNLFCAKQNVVKIKSDMVNSAFMVVIL